MAIFFIRIRRTPRSTLFPYTALFRSVFLVLAAGVGLTVAFLLARQLVGGVGQALKAAKGIAEGDVDQHVRSEEHTSELQSRQYIVCRPLLEKTNHLSRLSL